MKRVMLIKTIKLDEKKIMIKVNGLFMEYAPINRFTPKIVKKTDNKVLVELKSGNLKTFSTEDFCILGQSGNLNYNLTS